LEELDGKGRAVESEETEWSLRWATRQEMRYLFELTGFEMIAEFSDFLRSPPAYGTEQLLGSAKDLIEEGRKRASSGPGR